MSIYALNKSEGRIPYKQIIKFSVVDDLILELSYESGNFSMQSFVPNRPQVYIANLHHGHSSTPNYWGDKIKTNHLPQSDKGLGIKLLAWTVKNINTIFPEANNYPPEYWCGNFEPGYRYWTKTTLWSKLSYETYISNKDIMDWATEELDQRTIDRISEKVKIYDDDSFLKGGKRKKSRKSKRKSKRRSRKN
jgi:hypothetical protein